MESCSTGGVEWSHVQFASDGSEAFCFSPLPCDATWHFPLGANLLSVAQYDRLVSLGHSVEHIVEVETPGLGDQIFPAYLDFDPVLTESYTRLVGTVEPPLCPRSCLGRFLLRSGPGRPPNVSLVHRAEFPFNSRRSRVLFGKAGFWFCPDGPLPPKEPFVWSPSAFREVLKWGPVAIGMAGEIRRGVSIAVPTAFVSRRVVFRTPKVGI